MEHTDFTNYEIIDRVFVPDEELYWMYKTDKDLMSKYDSEYREQFSIRLHNTLFPDTKTDPLSIFQENNFLGELISFYIEEKMLEKEGKALTDIYSFNSAGYRSENFFVHQPENKKLHVLFAGCSVTFGQGVPLEYSWPKIVYEKIKETKETTGFFNLATPGATNEMIIENVYGYIKKFGMPDVIFVLLPDLLRDFRTKESPWPKVYREVAIKAMMLEDYALSCGSKLILYSWWNTEDVEVVDKNQEKPTFPKIPSVNTVDDEARNRHIRQYKETDPSFLKYRAFDLAHPGLGEHDFYANLMYNSYHDT